MMIVSLRRWAEHWRSIFVVMALAEEDESMVAADRNTQSLFLLTSLGCSMKVCGLSMSETDCPLVECQVAHFNQTLDSKLFAHIPHHGFEALIIFKVRLHL